MEQRGPLLRLEHPVRLAHTRTASFSEMVLLVRWRFACSFASRKSRATAAASSGGTSAAGLMSRTARMPMAASGNSSQNEFSATSFFIRPP